jgi:hypothetical protein
VLKLAGLLLLALAVVAVALGAWFFSARGNERVSPRAERPEANTFERAVFTPAAQTAASKFIATAVARRDPAAWRLLDPTFPCMHGNRKDAWQSGEVRFVPAGPFKMRAVSVLVAERLRKGVLLDVVIRRDAGIRGRSLGPVVYKMALTRHGQDRWLVSWWDIPYGPPTAWCA